MQFPLTDLPSPFRRSKQQVEEGKGEEASRGNTWAYVEAIDISDEGNNSAYEHANFAPKRNFVGTIWHRLSYLSRYRVI